MSDAHVCVWAHVLHIMGCVYVLEMIVIREMQRSAHQSPSVCMLFEILSRTLSGGGGGSPDITYIYNLFESCVFAFFVCVA